jgi:phosphatidylglycerophosphatase C
VTGDATGQRPRVVAAFDFDGTLTNGGSVLGFLEEVVGRPAVLAASIALLPEFALAAVTSGPRADRAKERLFERVLAGTGLDEAERAAARYGPDHLDAHGRRDVWDRLDWHRRRGDKVVVVSASLELYVGPAADRLGADGVLATRLEVAGDVLTGHYDGANCRGQEKLRRLRLWIDNAGIQPDRVWAYGNSRGDLTMLRAVDVGVNVGRLGRVGALRGYPGLRGTGPEARLA